VVTSLKCSSQPVGSICGKLRGFSIDDHKQRVHLLRERGVESNLTLSPGELGRDEFASIGVDGKFFVGEEDGADRRQRRDGKHNKRAAAAGPYDPDDKRLKHAPILGRRNCSLTTISG